LGGWSAWWGVAEPANWSLLQWVGVGLAGGWKAWRGSAGVGASRFLSGAKVGRGWIARWRGWELSLSQMGEMIRSHARILMCWIKQEKVLDVAYMCFNLDAWNDVSWSGRLVGELIIEFRLLFASQYWFVIVCLKPTGTTHPPALLCLPKVQRIWTE
jgi:hypothetical protein